MRRRPLNLLTALSLLLCLAMVALWVQSDWYGAAIYGELGGRSYGLLSKRGMIEFSNFPRGPSGGPAWGYDGGRIRYDGSRDADLRMRDNGWKRLRRSPRPWHWLGFTHAVAGGPDGHAHKATAPHAAVALAALFPIGVLPAVRRTRRRRANRRVAHTLCPICAYDLRATPGRCPECGNGREVVGTMAAVPRSPVEVSASP